MNFIPLPTTSEHQLLRWQHGKSDQTENLTVYFFKNTEAVFLLKVIIFFDGEWAAGTPGKLTCWISKVVVWKMSFLFNWLIFRLHIGFRGVFRWKYPSWPLFIASWSWRKRKTISFSDPLTGWWFQPNWKTLVKLDHFPSRGENIFKKWNHQLESIKTISTKITVDSHVNQFKSSPVSRYIFQTTLKCLPIPNDFCWRWNPRIAILVTHQDPSWLRF